MSATLPPIIELRQYIALTCAKLRGERLFGPLFHVRVLDDIAADIEAEHRRLAAEAYAAEQENLEALSVLNGLNKDELPAVARACRLMTRSAERGAALCESLRA